ncbi:MAG: transcriptional repressor LexA, partial [Myxococcales bacterium]|nr:transcriptional repressor LexA [Myxococcales bacterium]
EIGERLGIKSTNGVNDHLKALERKGFLYRDPSKSRAIRLVDSEDDVDDDGLLSVPFVGRIAAGSPILAEENREATYRIDAALLHRKGRGRTKGDVFVLKVTGESMIEAGIFDGDMIFVEADTQVRPGEVVAAMVDGEATVKTYYNENGRIRLQPENSSMEPIFVEEKDGRDFAIMGRVIGVFRQV